MLPIKSWWQLLGDREEQLANSTSTETTFIKTVIYLFTFWTFYCKMGPKKKGKGSKLARMSEEERIRYMQHRAAIEEEARRRKEQLIANFMKVRKTQTIRNYYWKLYPWNRNLTLFIWFATGHKHLESNTVIKNIENEDFMFFV